FAAGSRLRDLCRAANGAEGSSGENFRSPYARPMEPPRRCCAAERRVSRGARLVPAARGDRRPPVADGLEQLQLLQLRGERGGGERRRRTEVALRRPPRSLSQVPSASPAKRRARKATCGAANGWATGSCGA